MSSKNFNTITDNLQRAFNAVLLQIVHSLEKDQQEELRFYFKELVKRGEPGALNILSSLEKSGKISWRDVSLLKEGLHEVRRLDLENNLTEFEIKRNLTALFDVYARKRQRMESSHLSDVDCAEKVAGYLLMLIRDVVQRGFDVSERVRSLVESREGMENLMLEFEEKSQQELSDPWSRLTLLVVITGEIVALALAPEGHRLKQEVMKLLPTVAGYLCSRILKLGGWEKFCDHVKKRYHLVYNQRNSVSDGDLNVKKQIADVVQHLKETTFFS